MSASSGDHRVWICNEGQFTLSWQPEKVEGFKRRREYFGTAHDKMTELGTTSHK
jgi:hypothetical protein